MMFHASEDFEVSVNPFQPSDIKLAYTDWNFYLGFY